MTETFFNNRLKFRFHLIAPLIFRFEYFPVFFSGQIYWVFNPDLSLSLSLSFSLSLFLSLSSALYSILLLPHFLFSFHTMFRFPAFPWRILRDMYISHNFWLAVIILRFDHCPSQVYLFQIIQTPHFSWVHSKFENADMLKFYIYL